MNKHTKMNGPIEHAGKIANSAMMRESVRTMEKVIALVKMARSLRSTAGIEPARKLSAWATGIEKDEAGEIAFYIAHMATPSSVAIVESEDDIPTHAIRETRSGLTFALDITSAGDIEALKERTKRNIAKDKKARDKLEAKLASEGFTRNAPPEVAKRVADQLKELDAVLTARESVLKALLGERE